MGSPLTWSAVAAGRGETGSQTRGSPTLSGSPEEASRQEHTTALTHGPAMAEDGKGPQKYYINESEDTEATDTNDANPNSQGYEYDTIHHHTTNSGVGNTLRSLRHLTREALPRLDHYRNLASIVKGAAQRPTLDDLHQPAVDKRQLVESGVGDDGTSGNENKFGWIRGVLVRCLLNIWGVILFLRLPWVTGQAGIVDGLLVVTAGNVVTVITTLSMAAISTNGQIKGGGTYYMISRSLGPEFGGAIGLIFSLANAIAASMYIVGFCESLNDLLKSLGAQIVDNGVNDIRIVGTIALVALFAICVIGMEWEARAQIVLLFVLIAAILNFIIGAFIGPLDDSEVARGFVGLNGTVLMDNMWSDYREEDGKQYDFFKIFAVFFPACTGILAGANISGDLKDPSKAIPKGTLLAIVITYISYMFLILLTGAVTVRDATGNLLDVGNMTFTACENVTCGYGLMNDKQVMELVAVFGPIIYAGCFAATLSSALASIVSAPKVFQALCKDKIFPYIEVFAKGYGKSDEPYRGYVLTFVIALVFTLIAKLDAIAPIITNFFLAAYALVNFSTFHATLQKSPSWRPTFKYYNLWASLLGGILCSVIMFMIEWWTALLTFIIIGLLYLAVAHRKPDINWGSSTQAQTYNVALSSVTTLGQLDEHVKTYRPQLLVLCGSPTARPPLMHFAHSITKNQSLLVAGHCLPEQQPQRIRSHMSDKANDWLTTNKIRGFYSLVDGPTQELAARNLMCNVGLGKLRPNCLLMGYKNDWPSCPSEDLHTYFKTIHNAFDLHLAVAILRVEGGLDYSHVIEVTEGEDAPVPEEPTVNVSPSSNTLVSMGTVVEPSPQVDRKNESLLGALKLGKKKKKTLYRGKDGEEITTQVVDSMLRFSNPQPKGTIDVWWLYDDGGLTLLIPYILSTRSLWANCSLRVFCLANKKDDLASEHRRMAELLCKFRIDFTDVVMIPDVQKRPSEESTQAFNELIKNFRLEAEDEPQDDEEPKGITESELIALKDKTNRHIRLRELLNEHSKDASMIVMTLPMPRMGTVSSWLYMAWLETLTAQMPPFLLLRGNQTSVLTFYS